MITRYLEKINFAPRIAEKVSGSFPRACLTDEQKRIVLKKHDSCFYCGKKLSNRDCHMDHVIPF